MAWQNMVMPFHHTLSILFTLRRPNNVSDHRKYMQIRNPSSAVRTEIPQWRTFLYFQLLKPLNYTFRKNLLRAFHRRLRGVSRSVEVIL